MNQKHYLLILMLVASIITSCKKDTIEYRSDFQESYKTWQSFKSSSNNSYRYKVYFGSWTGYSEETMITVKDGKVIERSYKSTMRDYQSNQVTVREEWIEDSKSLNTHTNGHSTITLDEVYEKAKTVWLVKRQDGEASFETKNNGMISAAGFVPAGCQDDCFNGIHITSIEAL